MYEYKKRIGFSECDTDKRFTVTALIDAFQDCSTFQSEDAGVGFEVLEAMNMVWVINYWELQILSLPKLCDTVTVGTYPYSFRTCFGLRNFYLKDENGDFLVKANSMWTLLDSVDVKPVRAPEIVVNAYETEERLDMPYSSRKVLIPEGEGVSAQEKEPVRIEAYHLDSNHHMNNGQYVKMAMSYLPAGKISSLRIDYRRQAMLGDKICPVVYEKGNEMVVALYDDKMSPFSVSQYIYGEKDA